MSLIRAAHHTYSVSAIELTLKMILDSAVGFRACSAVLDVVHELFPQLPAAPAPNTVQSWLLRVGLHELQRPKEKAADWVVYIDHTLQLGAWKCLVMVGIRQSLWEQLDRFVKHCGQTQPKVKQTELGHLAPPTQKTKARYMNLGPLIRWGEKMLRLVDTPAPQRPEELDLSRLDEKFGWIREFRAVLGEWNDLETVKDHVLDYGRVQGYHVDASEQLREQLGPVAQTPPGRRLATALIEFVGEQSKCLEPSQSLPASSEVLESLIGKGKRLQGQHSRGGFTHMILGMAASVVQITHDTIKQALESVRDVDLREWCAENLGPSLTAQRRQALPAIRGTKTG